MRYFLAMVILLVAGTVSAQCVDGVCPVRSKVRHVVAVPVSWVGQTVAPVVHRVADVVCQPVQTVRCKRQSGFRLLRPRTWRR